tara:strand:- start:35628 stop:36071 length:444 start_codon:yes stop_codon:yes gene_type:complete
MKFRLSPLAVIAEIRPKGATGGTVMFVVLLPPSYPPQMLAHELHHVKQWWAFTLASAVIVSALATAFPIVSYAAAFLSVGVFGVLYRFIPAFRFKAEAAAYAASYEDGEGEILDYARALSSPLYATGRTLHESRDAIRARADDGRLI